MTKPNAVPYVRPCESLQAKLWIEFAKEAIRRTPHPTIAARDADEMVRLFFERYPARVEAKPCQP